MRIDDIAVIMKVVKDKYKIYMDQALRCGGIECPECGELINSEDGTCGCGWVNPIPEDIIRRR